MRLEPGDSCAKEGSESWRWGEGAKGGHRLECYIQYHASGTDHRGNIHGIAMGKMEWVPWMHREGCCPGEFSLAASLFLFCFRTRRRPLEPGEPFSSRFERFYRDQSHRHFKMFVEAQVPESFPRILHATAAGLPPASWLIITLVPGVELLAVGRSRLPRQARRRCRRFHKG